MSIIVNMNLCIGCGTCLENCKHGAFDVDDTTGVIFFEAKYCKSCHTCSVLMDCRGECVEYVKKNTDIGHI